MSYNAWQGARVRLRGIEPNDWEQFHRWDTDSSAQRSGHRLQPPRSNEAARQWARDQSQPAHDGDEAGLAIETLDGKLVGSISTQQCDRKNGSFNIGVALGRDHWGKGYASDAVRLILTHYFAELRYHKANARIYAFNPRSVQLFEAVGFQAEGRIRQAEFAGGEHHDLLWYGITAPEFRERHPDAGRAATDEAL